MTNNHLNKFWIAVSLHHRLYCHIILKLAFSQLLIANIIYLLADLYKETLGKGNKTYHLLPILYVNP